MYVNFKKTEIMVFRNGGPLRNYDKWKLNDEILKVTSCYKYMGLVFSPKLSWSKAKTKLCAQSRKAIFTIKRFQYNYGNFQHHEIFKLFDSMVVPILTNGSEL